MDLVDLLRDLFFDHTLRTVALGAATLGIVSGALGSYAVLRRQSLLGDAMSHAALPGVVIAFMLTRSKEPIILLLGAIAAGWIATLAIMRIVTATRVKFDSALGLVLSVFFGFGLMLLTFAQKLPDSRQAGLNTFLFGQAAALLERDVITMATLGAFSLLILVLFWKEFKLLSFDPDFGASLGLPIRFLDFLLTTLLVVAIVIGLQAVGVVLMSAMLVAPAAAARQWTDRLGVMAGLSSAFGALAGVTGAVLSSTTPGLSTGPTVVLCIGIIVLFSFLLAPNRGLAWAWVRQQRNKRRLQVEAVLSNLYKLASQHEQMDHAHSAEALRAMNLGAGGITRTLEVLASRGWVRREGDARWFLTPAGLAEAERLARGME